MKTMEVGGQLAVQATTEMREKKAGTADSDFSALLDGELAAGSDTAAGTTASVGAVDSITRSEIPDLTVAGVTECSTLADAIEMQLGRLEEVGNSLQNEGVDLKTVDAMLTNLGEEAKSLDSSLESLPEEHPLRQIGDELNVLTYVESVKWNRGDYL